VSTEYVILIVYVPLEDTARVRRTMCDAGAGTMDDERYDRVAYVTPCTLHYRVLEQAHEGAEAAGQEYERPQNRIEAICRRERVEAVVQAIVDAHPHGTPAISILPTLTGEFKYWSEGVECPP
jgi:hypothetical protein